MFLIRDFTPCALTPGNRLGYAGSKVTTTRRTYSRASGISNGRSGLATPSAARLAGELTSEAGIGEFLTLSQRTLDRLDQQVLEAIIGRLMAAWRQGRTVFVMGNGGSASTATHFAADLAKYTISPGKPRFKVLCLTDNVPLVSAWTNDGGFNSIFVEQMAPWLEPDDVLVGFSVHGGSGA